MSREVYPRLRVSHPPATAFPDSCPRRVRCDGVTGRRFSWRWVVFASIPVVITGIALVVLADEAALRSTGLVIFVLGSCLYIAARIALILEGRR